MRNPLCVKSAKNYRRLAERVPDPLLAEGAGKLIEEMEAQKAELHPELGHGRRLERLRR